MRLWVLVADERGEVRDDAVDGGICVAKGPGGLDARMRFPIHRPYMEMAMKGSVEPSHGAMQAAVMVRCH